MLNNPDFISQIMAENKAASAAGGEFNSDLISSLPPIDLGKKSESDDEK